jgi:drug/metabolite transporter (DMT)-like permease
MLLCTAPHYTEQAHDKECSMEPSQQTHQRPGTVTIIVVLAWIAGILNIVAGIFVIIDRHDRQLRVDSAHTPNELLVWGIAAIVIGAIYCLLASYLGRGSRGARLVFGIVAVLNLAGGAYAAIAYSGEQRASGVVSMIFSIIVLWLLYGTEKDREFFAA